MVSWINFLCVLVVIACIMPHLETVKGYRGEETQAIGTLAGDVQNWAMLIENYILQLASDGIKRDLTQSYLDKANYTSEKKNGSELVQSVKKDLKRYFEERMSAAKRLADTVRKVYDEYEESERTSAKHLSELPFETYYDSDVPDKLPKDLEFSPYFRQPVSFLNSTIKIADEVPRDDPHVIDTVLLTRKLEETFRENAKNDSRLRWQYFGSSTGVTRLYPGREWSTNFAGFYDDYDPRVRPWYIQATSGPKDVIIILDCSFSMKGEKFSIAKAVAITVINTLTKQDYVNVICARNSHWNEVGKSHFYDTQVLSCQKERLVPATNAYRKDLKEKISKLKAGGTSELEKGFDTAFGLLKSVPRTGCLSIIVFATDGKDTDGEDVRCGPGYYTRSGYVPGPICKYNFTSVYSVVMEKNKDLVPNARIFSYLIVEDAEKFPGRLACDHNGSMLKLLTGENLITQMANYFEFLSAIAITNKGLKGRTKRDGTEENASDDEYENALWTAPYLDSWGLNLMITYAVPVTSKLTGKYVGVVGIDATLDEIENFLKKHQWGSVYSFLINSNGGVIFHPKLKPSTKLLEDPIYIPISGLEQDNGSPAEFSEIEDAMIRGETGVKFIQKARDGKARTYFYASITNMDYSFAFSLASEDMEFRRSQEPLDRSHINDSYYNLLKMYASPLLRKELPNMYELIDVRERELRYPGLRITYKHSTIFLAPQSHCDPIRYSYNDSLAEKTLEAHKWINGVDEDKGCDIKSSQMYNKGVRRPWYKRTSSAPHKTSVSTPYMDSAGVGKVNTISQAVFEGMTPKTTEECAAVKGPKMGGCPCDVDSDCYIKRCYMSEAEGPNKDRRRCATERVEAVTGLDILYDDFQNKTLHSMQASDFLKSCGQIYNCPNGLPGCTTRCYLFDYSANLVMDPDFLTANALDKSQYESVTLGRKEGEVMKHLVYHHKFFKRKESQDFQGSCTITPAQPKVTLEGLPQKPEDHDDYYRNRGKIPKFHNDFGCIQDVVSYSADDDAL
ncbi:voltage-dependent calcium channel subunit alpha-2/delta-2-like, partial [Elysia marginata]